MRHTFAPNFWTAEAMLLVTLSVAADHIGDAGCRLAAPVLLAAASMFVIVRLSTTLGGRPNA